jgi:hypothetical protein
MSKLISQLPESIKQRALECQRECTKGFSKTTDILEDAFCWESTDEGDYVWDSVSDSDYTLFHFHHNLYTQHTELTQRIESAQDYQQLLEVSHYVEREYEGDKTELRKLIDAKFKPDLDNYPLGK